MMNSRIRSVRSQESTTRRLALLGLGLLASVILAACGSSSSSSGSNSGTGGASSGALNSAQAQQLKQLLAITPTEAAKLKGKTFKIGAILPLSGAGATFAVDEGNGVKLAVDQMRRYLGINVDYKALDHKSGDPQAGAADARQLGIAGYGAVMNSYYGVFGATLPALQSYHMLSFDPGGGTGNGFKGKPYFWGFRANTPDDGFFALRWFHQERPSLKRVAQVIWDAGAAYVNPIQAHLKARIAENGDTFVGSVLSPIGATDYSTVFSKLKDLNPQIIQVTVFGADPGYFMKQYVNSGLTAQVLGAEWTPVAAQIAGSAFKNWYFGADYFNPSNPPNPYSKFFVTDYQRLFGAPPNSYYEPNYYEATMAFLQLALRVMDKGGDINSGQQLNAALIANPTFKSLYGGNAATVGTLTLDPTTHDPTIRPVGLFIAGPPQKELAQWNIGDAAGFKILSTTP